MMLFGSVLKGFAIEASDGSIGTVSDFLFDDRSWTIRWMVIDTGTWLPGRKLLIHPSAIGQPDYERKQLPVRLTKAELEGSPNILSDEPVSRLMEDDLYCYYGWNPLVGAGTCSGAYKWGIGSTLTPMPYRGDGEMLEATRSAPVHEDGHTPLRSVAAVTRYHIQAKDGQIGHIENFLVDNMDWGIRYLIIATRNWWPGQHVLMSPHAVREISWSDHDVTLDVTRDQVKGSPAWSPLEMIEKPYVERLHGHYGWPGYGGDRRCGDRLPQHSAKAGPMNSSGSS